jgi:hypothetical protein
MVVYFYLGSAVMAGRLYIEHISFIPVSVVDLVELVGARVEQVLSVHDVPQEGVYLYVGGQIDYLHLDYLELGSIEEVEVLKVEFIVHLRVYYLSFGELVLPEEPQLLP